MTDGRFGGVFSRRGESAGLGGRAWRAASAAAALALGAGGVASAQDLTGRAPAQAEAVALTNAEIHPVSGPVIRDGYVLFERGRITAVGGSLPRLAQPARVIDARTLVDAGATPRIYPGLLSATTEMGLTEIAAVRASRDLNEVGAVTPEVRAAVAVNPDSWLMPVARTNGVLLFGVFPQGGAVPGRVSVIAADGWTWEDMAVDADVGVVVAWPFMRTVTAPWMNQSEEDQRKEIRQSLERIRGAFEDATAYLDAKDADPTRPTDLRWEAMRGVLGRPAAGKGAAAAAKPARDPVFIEAQDYDQIVAAVAFGQEFGLRVVITGGRDAALCADLLKKHGVPVIFNSPLTMPKRDDSAVDEAFGTPGRLLAAGVRFAIASGERAAHERNLPYVAALCVAHGLEETAAIKAITLWPAEILGVADRVGSLEAGKDATLIVTDGDPLEVSTRTVAAYVEGRPVDLSNKQTELAAKYREKYRQQKAAQGQGAR